jgi:hypothetical protein
MSTPIYVIIHVATIGTKFHEILVSQLKRIIDNKPFYERIKAIYIFTVGEINLNIRADLLKIKTQHLSNDPSVGESITLRIVSTLDIEPEAYILYLHTKGVSYYSYPTTYENVTAWRLYLEYENIDRWQECVKKLEEGYQVVGTELKPRALTNYGFVPRHFAGGFFWMRFKLLKEHIWHLSSERNGVEFWNASDESLKVWNMFSSNKNLYLEKIEEKEYKLP